MRIDRIELRILRLPLVHFFETSFGRTDQRTFILVTLESGRGRAYGECVADEHPFYSSESVETAWHVLHDYLAPAVVGREFAHPRDVAPAWPGVRGHHMAKAALEMAAWDLYAREQNVSLATALGGTRARIHSGVSIGIQASLDALAAKVRTELDAGYRRIKIKIKKGWDVEPVAMLRDRFGDIPLMVDANAAYSLGDAEHLAQLDRYRLMMIEQPLDHDDLDDHAALQGQIETPICLDESIASTRAAARAIRIGACRIINVKPGRLGGFGESLQLHALAAAHGVPLWHGGMLESGIGRAHNIHLSSLPGFTLPGDVAASKRYYVPDVIDPPVEVDADGSIPVPDGPGIGARIVQERVDRASIRVAYVGPSR